MFIVMLALLRPFTFFNRQRNRVCCICCNASSRYPSSILALQIAFIAWQTLARLFEGALFYANGVADLPVPSSANGFRFIFVFT